MRAAISAFFQTLFTLFVATNKFASAIDDLASITKDETEGLRKEMAVERQAKLKALEAKLAEETKPQ